MMTIFAYDNIAYDTLSFELKAIINQNCFQLIFIFQ